MVRAARAVGVRLTGLAHYCRAPAAPTLLDHTVVIGYGALPPEQIVPLSKALKPPGLRLQAAFVLYSRLPGRGCRLRRQGWAWPWAARPPLPPFPPAG